MLEFHNVTRRFIRSYALRFASFRVPAGSITALLGPNGAGKSTALKIALNLLPPTSGAVKILGVDSRKISAKELAKIGYVAEGMELPDWMNVAQFLDWCRPLYPTWDSSLENLLLEKFTLPLERKIKDLSRGQRMKSALIAALSYRPELLILDEPFSGLDPLVRDELIFGLLELAGNEKFTVVVSSHDIEEVDKLADHIVMLNNGAVLLSDSTADLLEKHRKIQIVLPPDFSDLPPLPSHWQAVERSGRVLRFMETNYHEEAFHQTIQQLFPHCTSIDINHYKLRELFVQLVKNVEVGSIR